MARAGHLSGMIQVRYSKVTPDARARTAGLAQRARDGCALSFAALAREWHPRLLAHALRLLGQRELAADATQSAWLEIARSIRSLREPQAFSAWAYRIVTRRCAKAIGVLQTERRLRSDLTRHAADASASLDEGPAELAMMRQSITRLPPDQRAALALHYFEDLSIAEVAVALDVPAGTVKTRLMHARRGLLAQFNGDRDEQD